MTFTSLLDTGSVDRPRDRGQRGLVEDDLNTVDGSRHARGVAQIALKDLDAVCKGTEVLPPTSGEVVQDPHVVAEPDQPLGDV